jgi:hypothetical protein
VIDTGARHGQAEGGIHGGVESERFERSRMLWFTRTGKRSVA